MNSQYIFLLLSFSLITCDLVKIPDSERKTTDPDWWKTATIYQIYPKSFKDTNDDGIGDIAGIIEGLYYIEQLGVQAIWLSSIFKSPQIDNGYDISDYYEIWESIGPFDDFQKLIEEAHEEGLKVIIDFIPNHTSDQHRWFRQSAKNETFYRDYYVWKDCEVDENGNVKKPPNNWRSVFGGSAWTYHKKRNQCYLHQFLKEQPDLNYRHPNVWNEMTAILKYWLDRNLVDGIRIGAVPYIYEDKTFADEPTLNEEDKSYAGLKHIYTRDQPETYVLIQTLRQYLDKLTKSDHNITNTRIMFTEASDLNYYGDGTKNGAHFTSNFRFLKLNENTTAKDIGDIIKEYTEELKKLSLNYIPNWSLGNHDTHRIASRVGSEKVDGLNMLTAFLPGIQVTYQGDELGMTNGEVDCETQGKDFKDDCKLYPEVTRDYERTPFQWFIQEFAGFTSGNETWLPVNENYQTISYDAERLLPTSHLNIYKAANKLRNKMKRKFTSNFVEVLNREDNVLHLRRVTNSQEVFDYLFNMNDKYTNVTLLSKGNIQVLLSNNIYRNSSLALKNTFELTSYESIIVTYKQNGAATNTFFSYVLLLLVVGLITKF